MSSRSILGLVLLLFLLVLSSLVIADPSFSSGPSVNPATNVTTTSSFSCDLTALGTGTITANVSWFKDGSFSGLQDSVTIFNGVSTSLLTVNSGSTTKGESWYCNVTLEDDNTVIGPAISSSTSIVNSAPYLTAPLGPIVWYEDTPYSSTANATDPDGDISFDWFSSDRNFTTPLFEMTSGGFISFTAQNDSVAGNHTMALIAFDDDSALGGGTVIFDIRAVNDVPILTTLNMGSACTEDSFCSFTLLATDEEDDNITFFSDTNFINLVGTSGVFSFTPIFNQTGTTPINITLLDDRGANASYIFTLEVDSINKLPIINFQELVPSVSLQNDISDINYTLNASDADINDTINFTISTNCSLANPWFGTRIANGSGSTNASFIITKNPGVTDNNSFVVCRDITVTYFDVDEYGFPKEYSEINVSMNITNENDAPYINQFANFTDNNGLFDMHNIATATSSTFYFRINGSDPDSLTYEGETFFYSIFGGNSSLFSINATTGNIISLVPFTESQIGNLSFFVNLTDDQGLSFTETLNLTVVNNSAPLLDVFNNTPCVEDIYCSKTISVYDLDSNLENVSSFSVTIFRPRLNSSGDVVHDDYVDYNLSEEDLFTKFVSFISYDSSRTNYTINFTPTNNDTGHYFFQFSFIDSFGAVLTDTVEFHVFNYPDTPLFDDDDDHSTIENLTFPNVVVGVPFEKEIYIFDEDLQYGIDSLNLTFNLSSNNFSVSDFQLTNTSEDVFVLTFNPNASHLGNHQINFTINDTWNRSSSISINFTVVPPGIPPDIDEVQPWSKEGVIQNSLIAPPLSKDVSVSEGQTIDFKVTAHDDTPDDELTLMWYKNDVLVDTWVTEDYSVVAGDYILSTHGNISFDYFDAGIVPIRVDVVDLNFNTVSHNWSINVENTNRLPVFFNSLSDLSVSNNRSVSGPTQYYDFFSLFDTDRRVFFDSDDDFDESGFLDSGEHNNLIFTPNPTAIEENNCLSIANFEFTGGNLIIVPTTIGTCYVNFTANDSDGGSVTSNIIRIDILDTQSDYNDKTTGESTTITETKTITVPFTEEVDVPEEFNLIIPGVTVIYDNGTVVIPLKLRNNWGSALMGIQLTANSSYDFQEFTFSQDYFSIIPDKMTLDVNLTMTNYRADAPFEVNVSAFISSEDYTDVAVIFMNALERGREDSDSLRSRIGFARDLLSDNPECEELNELLNEAELKADGRTSEGLEILNAVINSCKYLINEAQTQESQTPQSFLGKLGLQTGSGVNFPVLAVIVAVLFIGALLAGVLSSFKLKKI